MTAVRDRTAHLTKLDDIQRGVDELSSTALAFEAANTPTDETGTLVGRLNWREGNGDLK